MLSCHFKSLGSLDIAACLHCKRGHLSAAWTDQLLISFLQKSEASIYMHLECVFISEMDKNGIFVWWLIHHSQIECCVCQRSGMECHVYAEKRNRKYCYRIPWNLPTSQFSCMILWLIHTSTNRLLHQGAAFWLWDQCRQRDKVLLQVGRLIEEEIDSWWWSGGWCIIVIVAMLPLSWLRCCHCHCCNVVRIVVSVANRIDLSSILQRALLQHRHQDWEWTNQALAAPTPDRLFCFAHETLTSSADSRCKDLETQFPIILAITCLPLSWRKCHFMLSSVESIMAM